MINCALERRSFDRSPTIADTVCSTPKHGFPGRIVSKAAGLHVLRGAQEESNHTVLKIIANAEPSRSSDVSPLFCGQHPDLVAARKSCQICITRNPGKIHAGASFDFDPNVVSYWSQWLGHPQPHILVIGQDFGDTEYFRKNKGVDAYESQTNNNLFKLLTHIGLNPGKPPNEDRRTRVFLTNSILCLKEPPMNRPLRASWVRACAITHLRPLVQKLNPPIAVAMGAPGWQAAQLALEIEGAPKSISTAAGGMWATRTGIQVFAVGHCGPLGLANRSWATQLEDWSRISDALKRVTQASQ